MTHMTIREKEQWQSRVQRLTERVIQMIVAKNDPAYADRIRRMAVEKAEEMSGLKELRDEARAVDAQIDQLRKRRDEITKRMFEVVEPLMLDTAGRWQRDVRFDHLVDKRARLIEEELLSHDSLGRKILAVRKSAESLLDALWLAQSREQVEAVRRQITAFLTQYDSPSANNDNDMDGTLVV